MLMFKNCFVLIYFFFCRAYFVGMIYQILYPSPANESYGRNNCGLYTDELKKKRAFIYFLENLIFYFINIILYWKFFYCEIKKLKNQVKKLFIESIKYIFTDWGINIIVSIVFKRMRFKSNNQSIIEAVFVANPCLMWITACILGPLNEEVVFRKILYMDIKGNKSLVEAKRENARGKIARIIGLLIFSSLLFALIHVNPLNENIILGIPYFTFGLVAAFAYENSSLFFLPVVIHMLSNILCFF